MKKFGFLLFILIAAFASFVWWYVKPEEKLDLSYSPFAAEDKLQEMINVKRFEFHISETDINNILKKELASNPVLNDHVKVTGARFELNQDQLIAHLNLMYDGWLPIGTVSYYRLTWENPKLRATPLNLSVRNVNIPASILKLPVQETSFGSMLPSFLTVQNVSFEQNSIAIYLHFL